MYDLTKFNKPFEEITTVEDRWLYLLKHAGAAENLPDFNDDVIAKAIERLLVKGASVNTLKEQLMLKGLPRSLPSRQRLQNRIPFNN